MTKRKGATMNNLTQKETRTLDDGLTKVLFRVIKDGEKMESWHYGILFISQLDKNRFVTHVEFSDPDGANLNIMSVKTNGTIRPTLAIYAYKGEVKYYPILLNKDDPGFYGLSKTQNEPPEDAFQLNYQ